MFKRSPRLTVPLLREQLTMMWTRLSAPLVLLATLSQVAALSAVASKVTEQAAAQVFARLADKKLLLDVPGAGTPEMKDCCHGGCDNCDYSRVFDEMNAGKAKWVACYLEQEHSDGRRHEAPMAAVFGDDDEVSAATFVERLADLEAKPSMGAKVADINSDYDAEAVEAVFYAISGGADSVGRDEWAAGLTRVTGEEHGAAWRPFLNGLTK